MKTTKWLSILGIALLLGVFSSCENNEAENTSDVNLPNKFSIDIPASVSNGSGKKMSMNDTLKGGDLYEHLRTFINVGETSAQFVEDIIQSIQINNLDQELSITYTEEDGRAKDLTVVKEASFEGAVYNYGLTVKDGSDYALELYWNNEPVKGTAILHFAKFDYNTANVFPNTRYRIDYSEAGDMGYDQHMIVYITDYPVEERFGLDNLKMFVGKKGDEIEIMGNSNHPELWLFDPQHIAYDWAFVARADAAKNIAVAQVGLPPADLATLDGIFDTYAIKNVLSSDFHSVYDELFDPILISIYLESVLADANSPAYFNSTGFVSSGSNVPVGFESAFIDISNLQPYIPKDIKELELFFQAEQLSK
jgi:hypothetical protein